MAAKSVLKIGILPSLVAAFALVMSGAKAEGPSGQIGASGTSEPAWHRRDHPGGHGHGDNNGDNEGDGSIIIGPPSSSGPGYPYPPGPYPKSGAPLPTPIGTPPAQNSGSAQSWPVWYYCDQPTGYYPYVKVCGHDWQRMPIMPPPLGSAPPIATASWERCDDPQGYFPYVARCRHHWEAVVASIPVPADYPEGIPVIGQWFYCQDTKDYLPYVGSCPHIWTAVPAMPPPNIQSTKHATASANQH